MLVIIFIYTFLYVYSYIRRFINTRYSRSLATYLVLIFNIIFVRSTQLLEFDALLMASSITIDLAHGVHCKRKTSFTWSLIFSLLALTFQWLFKFDKTPAGILFLLDCRASQPQWWCACFWLYYIGPISLNGISTSSNSNINVHIFSWIKLQFPLPASSQSFFCWVTVIQEFLLM